MMGDSFTNLLLITLIGVLGTIAKIFYDKLVAFEKRMEQIFLKDLNNSKDIQANTKEILKLHNLAEKHQERIADLERTL